MYYLRVEGVNLDNFVYDTNDLPTIRGGGLLLLDSMNAVEKMLNQVADNVSAISKGASWGLFRFSLADAKKPDEVKNDVVDCLNGADSPFKHATFVVDVLPIPSSEDQYVNVRNKLAALNRWQQMQAPSLAFPVAESKVCSVSKFRPASPNITLAGKPISFSVSNRREYGSRKKKQKFYTEKQGISSDATFTNDFSQLSHYGNADILDDKMAVIYIDGNNFGQHLDDYCQVPRDQSSFDQKVRNGQEAILAKLVCQAQKNETGLWKTKEDEIRLETLLWGGDEIIWVVPACLGLSVLYNFFKEADEQFVLQFEKEEKKKKKKKGRAETEIIKKAIELRLKHGAGLVFCHQKAPIHRITKLAKDLAEFAKEDKSKNLFTYQVLKSFDHAGTKLADWRSKRCESLGEPGKLILSPDELEQIFSTLSKLKETDCPRRKMYQILYAIKHSGESAAKELFDKLDEDHKEKSYKELLEKLKSDLGDSNVMWLHLVDLWDYVEGEL